MDGGGFDQAERFTVLEGGACECREKNELVRDLAVQIAALSQLIVGLVAVPGARRSLNLVADELSRLL